MKTLDYVLDNNLDQQCLQNCPSDVIKQMNYNKQNKQTPTLQNNFIVLCLYKVNNMYYSTH